MTQRISLARLYAVLVTISLFAALFPLAALPAYAAEGTLRLTVMADPDPLSEEVGEYLSLSYAGTEQIDITGWEIQDKVGRIHVIGSFSLSDSDSYTACRETDTALNGGIACDEDWGGENLRNSSETVTIFTADGTEVVTTGDFNAEPGQEFSVSESYNDNTDTEVVTATASLSVNPTSLEVAADTRVNFVASVTAEDGFDGENTVVSVSDATAGGVFYEGRIDGACNSETADSNNEFNIGNQKGICYSNTVAGTYALTVSLLTATGGEVVGEPVEITVIVAAVDTSDSDSDTDTDDGSATSTEDTATSTEDEGNDTSTDTEGSDDSTDSDTQDAGTTDPCEFEGHKYDEAGNPLSDWEIGLIKVVFYEGQSDVYTISTDLTDNDGFFCLRWTNDWSPAYDPSIYPNGYEFEYRIYEAMQTDWEFVSAEHGPDFTDLTVATEGELKITDSEAHVRVGEVNGVVRNDAQYHVDFYNRNTSTSTESSTTTDSGSVSTGGGSGGGSDDEAAVFEPLTLTSTCRVADGGMTFTVSNTNDSSVDASYEVLGTTDTATVTVAANTDTTFTTVQTTDTGSTTLSYTVATTTYAVTAVAVTTGCVEVSGSTGGGGGGGGGTRTGSRNQDLDSASPAPIVAGVSDSAPKGQVLGDQVSVVPFGGANAGAGGTSAAIPAAGTVVFLALITAIMAGFRRTQVNE